MGFFLYGFFFLKAFEEKSASKNKKASAKIIGVWEQLLVSKMILAGCRAHNFLFNTYLHFRRRVHNAALPYPRNAKSAKNIEKN